jgi:peroxiredoxin
MRRDIVPGAVFPDYELPDHGGKHHRLSELQGADPLIVVIGRGGFCAKDRRQLEGLLVLHREMEVGYCRLVTITELKAEWERGEKKRFFPYGKTYAQLFAEQD